MNLCPLCHQPMQVLFNVSYFCIICENPPKQAKGNAQTLKGWKTIPLIPTWQYCYLTFGDVVPKDAQYGYWAIFNTEVTLLTLEQFVLRQVFTTDFRNTGWRINEAAPPGYKLTQYEHLIATKLS